MKSTSLLSYLCVLFFLLGLPQSNQLKAQTFSCPYTIDNAEPCQIKGTWQINCSGGTGCSPCASGAFTINGFTIFNVPLGLCNTCLTTCSSCDIYIKVTHIANIALSTPIWVDSNNTSMQDASNTGSCCNGTPLLPTLLWYSTTTRFVCN